MKVAVISVVQNQLIKTMNTNLKFLWCTLHAILSLPELTATSVYVYEQSQRVINSVIYSNSKSIMYIEFQLV